jgi:hypothetical protein
LGTDQQLESSDGLLFAQPNAFAHVVLYALPDSVDQRRKARISLDRKITWARQVDTDVILDSARAATEYDYSVREIDRLIDLVSDK